MSLKDLDHISYITDEEVTFVVTAIDNPNRLRHYAEYKDIRFVRAVADNTHTPVDVLMKLTEVDDYVTARMLAYNSSCTTEILLRLWELYRVSDGDAYRWVRCALAINSKLPLEVLETFMTDHEDVRASLTQNVNLTEDMMQRLYEDESVTVRKALIKNQNLTDDILEKLTLEDDDDDIRWIARLRYAKRNAFRRKREARLKKFEEFIKKNRWSRNRYSK